MLWYKLCGHVRLLQELLDHLANAAFRRYLAHPSLHILRMSVAGSFSVLVSSFEVLDGFGCLVKEGGVMMVMRLALLDTFRRLGSPLRRGLGQFPLPMGLDLLLPRKKRHDKVRVIVDGLLQIRDQMDLFQYRRVNDFVGDVVGHSGQLALNLFGKREDTGARAGPGSLGSCDGAVVYMYILVWCLGSPNRSGARKRDDVGVVERQGVADV